METIELDRTDWLCGVPDLIKGHRFQCEKCDGLGHKDIYCGLCRCDTKALTTSGKHRNGPSVPLATPRKPEKPADVTTDFYTTHFGFSERPFRLLPDPDFIYWSAAHKRAFSVLEYGVLTGAPLTVVTGEVGAGKTTLIQELLNRLGPEFCIGLISNAQGGRGDLLRWVLNSLDIPPDGSGDYVTLFKQFQEFVISAYGDGQQVLLIIDEAQNLTVEALEELRMLTNINANKDELLQLILLGQPELRELLARPDLRQFAQRVTATYHLDAMDTLTTHAYVRHRLQHVGGSGREISAQAIQYIFAASHGTPRMVNKLCDLALVYAASAGADQVDVDIVKELIADKIVMPAAQAPPLFLTSRSCTEAPTDDQVDPARHAEEGRS